MSTLQTVEWKGLKLGFFGTPQIAVWVLDELERAGIVPALVVTNPDAPQGRKMVVTPSPVARWGEARSIETLKPETLRDSSVAETLRASACELFIVTAYGKIIPKDVLEIPKYGVLNVHPSLLPKLRGASPIRSAILGDVNPTGVSVMKLTEGLDEGPVLAQEEVHISEDTWPVRGRELDELLARKGGTLLAQTLPGWLDGKVAPKEQDHPKATYCTKITKEMGLIDLTADPYQNLLKIRAFDGWPGTFIFHEKNGKKLRVKVVDAELESGVLKLTRVIPEGKLETDWDTFIRS